MSAPMNDLPEIGSIGTLTKLKVNPGDGVEFVSPNPDFEMSAPRYPGMQFTINGHGGTTTGSNGGKPGYPACSSHKFKLISRATPAPYPGRRTQ